MPALYKPRSTVRGCIQGFLSALQERQSQYEVVQAVHPRPIVYSVNDFKVDMFYLESVSVSGSDSDSDSDSRYLSTCPRRFCSEMSMAFASFIAEVLLHRQREEKRRQCVVPSLSSA